MADQSVETGGIARIREAHAPQPYDFPTEQTYCPSSDVPSDQCHTCVILAAVEAECQRLAEAADRHDQAEQWEYAGGLREAAHHVREVVSPPAKEMQ